MKFLARLFGNFYFVSFLIFAVWVVFFDTNDLITQYYRQQRLKRLESEKSFYIQKSTEIKQDRRDLAQDAEALEKFAREKYFLKRPKEDVFIIITEKKDSLGKK